MLTSISIFEQTYLAIYKAKNGLIAVDYKIREKEQVQEEFVFRNTEELCEWLKEFYKEKP